MMGRMWMACIVAGVLLGGCSSEAPTPATPVVQLPTAEERQLETRTEQVKSAITNMKTRIAMAKALESDPRPAVNWPKELSNALARSGHKNEETGLLAAMEKECVVAKIPGKLDTTGVEPNLIKDYEETRKEYDPKAAELEKTALELERMGWLRRRVEAYGSGMPDSMRAAYLAPISNLRGCVPTWMPAGFRCRDFSSSPSRGHRSTFTGPGKSMFTIVTGTDKLADETTGKWKSDKEYPVKELEAPLRHFPKSVAGADRLQLISEKRGIRFDAIDMKPEDALKVIANM